MKRPSLLLLAGLVLVFSAVVVSAQKDEPEPAMSQRAVFKVENMTCGACFSKINSALAPMEGFSGMGANLLRKMVAVDFQPPLTPEAIGETITNLGYPASLDAVEEVTQKETFAFRRSLRQGYGGGGCCSRGASQAAQGPGSAGCAPPSPASGQKDI